MLVTLEQLKARLPFDLTVETEREATGALEDLSYQAQALGSPAWTSETNTPLPVKNLILRAGARHMKNYEGFIASRAGQENVQWTDRGEEAGSAYFTQREEDLIAQAAGRDGQFIGSVGTYAWGSGVAGTEGRVPTSTGTSIPYFHDGSPW